MSDNSLPHLPDILIARCRASQPPYPDQLIELAAADGRGAAHITQISVGELLLGGDGLLRIALWPGSAAGRAVLESQQALALFTTPGQLLELRLSLLAHRTSLPEHNLLGLLLRIETVRNKNAPYADILSGTRFRYKDIATSQAAWAATRRALLAAFPDDPTGAEKQPEPS